MKRTSRPGQVTPELREAARKLLAKVEPYLPMRVVIEIPKDTWVHIGIAREPARKTR